MAGGNLGDLSMTLTLKTRMEEESKKLINALNKIDVTGKQAQDALNLITEATSTLSGKGVADIKKLQDAVMELYSKAEQKRGTDLISEAIDLEAAAAKYKRVIELFTSANEARKKSKGFSEADEVQRVEEALQKRIHTREQEAKREDELEKQKQERQKISAQMAQETYRQEIAAAEQKSRAFAQALQKQMEAEERLRRARVGGTESERRRAVRTTLAPEPTRYYVPFTGNMDQINEVQKAYGKAFDALGERYDQLQQKIASFHGPKDDEWLVKTKAQLAEVESQMQRLVAASERLSMHTAARLDATYKPNATTPQEQTQRRLQETNALKNAILERMEAEKREAAEAAKNEKLRQAELDKSQQKIKALKDALNRLWGERQAGKALGLDTSEADAKIRSMISALRILREYSNMLGNKGIGWQSSLGGLNYNYFGTLAEGAKRLSSEQAKANSEKRQAIALEERHRQEVAATAARVRSDLVSAFEQARKSAGGMSSAVQDLKSLFLQGGLIYGAKQFADSIIQTGGEIVQQHVALRSIIGDIAKADELFAQTQQLALQSPFKFGELNRDVKQLAAFGVEANDLYDTTKRLADIASGLGVSFERLGLAYGQVKARSWLDGKELRQFAYAGLPLLKSIAEMYNETGRSGKTDYTESDIKKMISQRQVSFEDVQKVLWGMTDEGGKFYNMQLVLSNTLLGQWNKLIDAWDIMLGKFAEGNNVIGGVFTSIVKQAANLVLMLDKLSPALVSFGAMFALRKGLGAVAARTGIAQELTAMKAAQAAELRRYAIAQQRLLVEGKITQEELRQNLVARAGFLNGTINKRNAMEELAIKGKLSMLQMQRLVQERMISPELIKQLELMGMISSKQSELILKSGLIARSQLAWNQATSKLGSLLTGGNVAAVGAAVGAAIWMGYDQYTSKLEQSMENMRKSAEDHFKQLSDYVKGLPASPGEGDKIAGIDNMKDLLTQTGYFTDELNEQLEACGDINEEYDLLVSKTKESSENAKAQGQYTQMAANAMFNSQRGGAWAGQYDILSRISDAAGLSEHGGVFGYISGLFNDDLEKNSNDLNNSLMKVSAQLDILSSDARSKLESVADAFLSPEQRVMSLEEKIAYLAKYNSDAWEEIVRRVANGDETTAKHLKNIGKSGRNMSKDLKEIAEDDFPKIMESWRKDLGMTESEFKTFCQRNPKKFQAMFDSLLSIANISAPKIREALKRMWYEAADMVVPETPKPKKPKGWTNPLREGTTGRKTYDKLEAAGLLKNKHRDMANVLFNIDQGKSSGWHEYGEAIRKQYKEWRDENNQARKAGEKQPYYYKMKLLEEAAAKIGVSLDVGKDKVSGDFGKDGGNKDDKVLKALKDKVSLYKTYYTELQKYRKLYGADADKELMKDKNFTPIKGYGLKDRSDYGGSIRQLVGKLSRNTEERKSFVEQSIAGISSKEREEEQKRIEDVNSELSRKLDLLSEEYDLYKQLYDLTGDSQGAMQVAFQGNTVQSQSLLESLMKQIQDELDKSHPGTKAADVTALSDNDFNKLFGEKSEALSVLVQRYKKESDKVRLDTIKKMTDLIKDNRTLEQQIADLDREHESNQTKIWGSSTTTEMKKRASEGENKEWQDKRAKLEFEQFKNNTDWVTIFDDLDRVSSNTINTMCTEIERFSKKAGLSVEVVKQLRDALDKLRNEQIDRSPFGVMFNTIGQGNAIGDFLKRSAPGKDGKYIVSAEAGKRMGMQEGKYTKGELENERQGKYTDFSKSLQSVANKFKALESIMSPVIDLFAAFGKENTVVGGIMQGGSDALSAADSTAGALNNLGLENAGPYGAAAAAAISIISNFAAAHDAALEREIEASKQRQKEMENLTKNLQHAIEIALGGVYSYTMNDKTRDKLTEVLETFRKENTKFNFQTQKWEKTNKNKSRYSEQTAAQVEKSLLNKDSNFDAQLASLMVQRDELQKQRNAENKKKKKDKSAISDYDEQIEEANQQISEFAQEWAKTIYDIDLKDWASQLTDAIVEAWQKGEDAVDAYEDKVKELMNGLTKNILSQKIMEVALKPTLDNLENKLKANGGKLEAEDVLSITDSLIDAEGNAIDSIVAILDSLKEKGLDLSENGSLSTSNTIKGVTEETADLLASYINAIRLDVSVNRANLAVVVEAVKLLPNLNVIAQSQLTQLNTLVSLSQARNDKLDQMYDWMRSTTNGTRKLYIA